MDYGIKVSQKGFDVDNCADHQLLFSSAWPLFNIFHYEEKTFDSSVDTVLFTHNLGYPAMFIVYEIVSGKAYPYLYSNVAINNTELKWFNEGESGNKTLAFFISLYDMNTEYNSVIKSTTPASKVLVNDFGFKVSKEGLSTNSKNLKDFIIHTNTRALQIQNTKKFTVTSGANSGTITHNLGYEPFYLAFATAQGFRDGYWYKFVYNQADMYSWSTSTTLEMGTTYPGSMFGCVFKDPYLLGE